MRHIRPTLGLALLLSACAADPVTNTITLPGGTNTNTNTNTNTVTNTVVDDDLDPGHFERPMVDLKKIFDGSGALGYVGGWNPHLHVDEIRYRETDAKVFYCSYTFGVINAAVPATSTHLAQGFDWDMFVSPVGRHTGCLHLDWDDTDDDIIYVDHRGNYDFQPHLTAMNLNSDPLVPTTLAPTFGVPLQEPGVSYEGLDYEGGYVYIALHAGGIGVYQYDPVTTEMVRVGGNTGIVPNAYDIHVVGTTAYVVDELEGLYILDVSDINNMTLIGSLYIGGVDRDVRYDNGYVYIAAGTPGFAIMDVADPANPVLTSMTPAYGTVTRLGVNGDRVAVAAWVDTRVYDVTDKTKPAIIGGVRLEIPKTYTNDPFRQRPDITGRMLGVDIFGDTLFVGQWHNNWNFQIFADRKAPYMVVAEDVYYMDTGHADPGGTGTYTLNVRNDGTADLTIYDTWVTNPAFVVTPYQARVAPGADQDFTITFTAGPDVDPYTLEPVEESGIVNFVSDDPSYPVRQGYVVGNPVGIGVGDPYPYTEATDVNTLSTWTSDALAGQVSLVAYFATF